MQMGVVCWVLAGPAFRLASSHTAHVSWPRRMSLARARAATADEIVADQVAGCFRPLSLRDEAAVLDPEHTATKPAHGEVMAAEEPRSEKKSAVLEFGLQGL